MTLQVVKLDGRTQEFNKRKIEYAIQAAMNEVGELDVPTSTVVADKVEKKFEKQKKVSVSTIQDVVEDCLLRTKLKKAAKEYVYYRRKRNKEREENSSFMNTVKEIMDLKNLDRENANTNQEVFSSRNGRVADYWTRAYAGSRLLRDEVKEAFDENYIYIHDFNNYASGMHNCTNVDLLELLKGGFITNNSPIREPQSISSAMQLTAVVLQCQSNLQFGGIGCIVDTDLAYFVKKSFAKHFKDGLKYVERVKDDKLDSMINVLHPIFKETKNEYADEVHKMAYEYAWDKTVKETYQGAEGLIHNLNSLQSRASDQLPFTSINYGMDTTPEGRLVTKSLLESTIKGVGPNLTPIFPIQIFQYYKTINGMPDTPNFDLLQLSLQCTSKRIYPNYANASASIFDKPTCKQERFVTMGCRTQLGKDRFGVKGFSKRGNISPVTINLAKIGIEHGICLGKRSKPDLKGFWDDLDKYLDITVTALVDRFKYQASQKSSSAPFCYLNGILAEGEKLKPDDPVYLALRHGTLAIGLVAIANTCLAMFGKHHFEDKTAYQFALDIYKRFNEKKKEAEDKYNLNFSVYSSPCESSAYTMNERLVSEFGKIPGVIDRGYLTNSFHCPVWYPISAKDKIDGEAKFATQSGGGNIVYVEIDGSAKHNVRALEELVQYAMSKDIPYFALNVKIDTCRNCNYQDIIDDKCPKCGSTDIQRLRRITGYLAGDYKTQFNNGKQKEVEDRYQHVKGNILFE